MAYLPRCFQGDGSHDVQSSCHHASSQSRLLCQQPPKRLQTTRMLGSISKTKLHYATCRM